MNLNKPQSSVASIHELLERGLQRVVEALVFAADTPVEPDEIAEIYTRVTGEDRPSDSLIQEAVHRLNSVYEETERTFRIEFWAEGFRMATVASVAPFLKSYFNKEQEQRLSRSLMETLSIVAYKQPVTKPEVDFVRGVDAGYAVHKLLEKGLIEIVGRGESLGRPLLYGTTHYFLEQFGLSSLDDLPDLREIEDILDDPAFNRERAQLLRLQQEESHAAADDHQGRIPDPVNSGSGKSSETSDPEGANDIEGADDRALADDIEGTDDLDLADDRELTDDIDGANDTDPTDDIKGAGAEESTEA